MRATIVRTAILALVCTSLTTGCLFTVRHELPPNAYFGRLPSPPAKRIDRFEDHGMKNWLLAGLVPYTGWSTENLLEKNGNGSDERIQNLAIETRFGALDTIIWVVPGFFYGYYVWAPRTVEVRGSRVSQDRGGR
jgi:hypothetical protein